MISWEDKLVSRFLHYAAMHTASDSGSNTSPSTPEQMIFADHEVNQAGFKTAHWNRTLNFSFIFSLANL